MTFKSKPSDEAPQHASSEQDISQKLDTIIGYMHAMNKRDRMRYYGSIVHSLIAFIPMALFLASAWYLYQHGEELLTKVVGETVNQMLPSEEQMNILFGR